MWSEGDETGPIHTFNKKVGPEQAFYSTEQASWMIDWLTDWKTDWGIQKTYNRK